MKSSPVGLFLQFMVATLFHAQIISATYWPESNPSTFAIGDA